MTKPITSEAQFQAMMERCREEILRYQSAKAPGTPSEALPSRATLPKGQGGADPARPFYREQPTASGEETAPPLRRPLPERIEQELRQNAAPAPLPQPSPAEDAAAPSEEAVPAGCIAGCGRPEAPPAAEAPQPEAAPAVMGQESSSRTAQWAEQPPCTGGCGDPPFGETPAPQPLLPWEGPAPQENAPASPAEPQPISEDAPCAPQPLLPWEGFVPQGDAPEGDAPAASPVGELPASPLLPLVQEAIEEAARQALPPESEPVATVLLDCGRLGRVSGAAGVFAPSEGLAALFPDRMRETAARVRCCAWTAAGAPDAARCQRSVTVALDGWGGAMPFFLTPTIYSADPETMMRFERSVMPDGESGLRDPSRFWQAVTDAPESLSAVGVLFTDRGTPASWRALSGYTPPLVWETARGRLLARCTMTPAESARPLTREEAQELCLADGDALARDLWLALAQNDCPTWTLTAQLVPADRSMADPTSLWKEEIAPLELGTLTLTRNVSVTAARAWRMTTRIAAGRRNPAAAAPAFAMCSDEERRALAENLAEELEKLPADVLERVLLLITTEDLELGSALTAALGG